MARSQPDASLALQAIRDGDSARLWQILADDPKLIKDPFVSECLMDAAIETNRPEAVAILLDAGVSVNQTDGNNGTLLMTAAWHGHLEIAHLLLTAGADFNYLRAVPGDHDYNESEAGQSALYFALIQGHQPLIDLLDPIMDPEVRELAYEAAAESSRWRTANLTRHLPTVELFSAAQNSQLEALAAAIRAGAYVNEMLPSQATNEQLGGTPLAFAASRGRANLVTALLAAGADPTLADHRGRTAADCAALNGHAAIADQLCALSLTEADRADLFDRLPTAQTAEDFEHRLRRLIDARDEAGVRDLFTRKWDWLADHLNVLGPFVHLCVERELASILDAVLLTGTSANSLDEHDSTPLIKAAKLGNLTIARMLINAGADPNWVMVDEGDSEYNFDNCGQSALHFAQLNDDRAMIDLIEPETHLGVQYRAAVATRLRQAEQSARTGSLPITGALYKLFLAVGRNDADGIAAAVAGGAEINGRDEAGWTPLFVAVVQGRRAAVVALLASGAEVDAPADDLARTALWIALDHGKDRLLTPLLAAGADPDVTDENGRTLWQRAGGLGRGEALRQAWRAVHGTDPPA